MRKAAVAAGRLEEAVMRSFFLLLKIQLLGLFGINKALHANAAKAKRTLVLALVVVAIVAVVALYSVGVAEGMAQLGMVEAIPLVAVLVGAVAGAVAAFLKRTACCSPSRITTWSCRCRCPRCPWCCRASLRCTP